MLQAAEDAAGDWRATVISGTEVSPEGWVCVGGAGQSTGAEHLGLLAVPAGQKLPVSTSLACTAPAAATAAINPDVSTFSSALATPAQAFGSPVHTLVGAAITLGVILFITFPAQLFNRTFEENYDEIRDLTLRRLRWLRRFRREAEREAGGVLRFGAFARPWSWWGPPWAASTIAALASTSAPPPPTWRSCSRSSWGSRSGAGWEPSTGACATTRSSCGCMRFPRAWRLWPSVS